MMFGCGWAGFVGALRGLAMALGEGRLKRGDRVVLAPTGSGSSAGVISFVY